ncbi:MAG: hypothetical protein ABL886_03640 [Rhodoglobus sp.]
MITRTWLAFAAIGAGLIHVALVIGSPPALGVTLAVLGIAEFGWGVATFARDAVLVPRIALAVALAPVLLWGLLLAISALVREPRIAASLPFMPLAMASVFSLFIAGTLAVDSRRAQTEARPRVPGVARYLLGLVVGGLVVAGMTTPALAATAAGAVAQPHGEHSDAPAGEDGPYQLLLPGHDH